MFDNWGFGEWLILLVDIVAVIIVVKFLKNKVKKKLHEVEIRQKNSTSRKREMLQKEIKPPSEE